MFAYRFFLFHQLASSFFFVIYQDECCMRMFWIMFLLGFCPILFAPCKCFFNAKAWLRCLCLRKISYLYTLIVDAKLNSACAMREWYGNMKHQKKEE